VSINAVLKGLALRFQATRVLSLQALPNVRFLFECVPSLGLTQSGLP
jgi:hypothetical protein